jgi:hypothetical protein
MRIVIAAVVGLPFTETDEASTCSRSPPAGSLPIQCYHFSATIPLELQSAARRLKQVHSNGKV